MRILKLTEAAEKMLHSQRKRQDRSALRIAGKIVGDVRSRGDAALNDWARKLDGADVSGSRLWIEEREIAAASQRVNREFLQAIEHAARNIRRVAEKQLPSEWSLLVEPGVRVGQKVTPIDAIGCYIPGGRFALVSTLLMTVVPALVAGVKRIVAVCAKPNDELLAAAHYLGIKHVVRIGGAHAIAALAYGTKRIESVEKIFGPGNRYVTAAKQLVSGDCAIDLPAGPTEVVMFADGGNAKWVAADLLAQAEHAPDAGSFLVTTSANFAVEVQKEITAQLGALPKDNPAHQSIRNAGAILVARNSESALAFVNHFAAEHLSLPGANQKFLSSIHSAGTIFLGDCSAQPFGDYVSGSNHVLPTGGWARRRGGLSAADFVKCISVQTISRAGSRRLAKDAQTLARAEGLLAHSNAVEVRR